MAYAQKFTLDEWMDMEKAGLPAFIESGLIDEAYSTSLFESILVLQQNPEIAGMIKKKEFSFKQIVEVQTQEIKKIAVQSPLARPTEVIAWLGDELARYLEAKVRSYDEMDNIVNALSSRKVRAMLAGDKEAICEYPLPPPALTALKGQDARSLLLRGSISLSQLLDLAKLLSTPIDRSFPAWVGDNIELRGIANLFTDAQLVSLGELMDAKISNDRELKCSFLRAILLKTSIGEKQLIQECVDPAAFKRLVVLTQKKFIEVVLGYAVSMVGHIGDALSASSHPVIAETNDVLLRKYLAEYRSPHVPTPTDSVLREKAYGSALRNAANHGNFWDVLILIHGVKDIDAKGEKTGRTALHFAAAYAHRTGDHLCYELLAKQPGINFSIIDKEGMTPKDVLAGHESKESCRTP